MSKPRDPTCLVFRQLSPAWRCLTLPNQYLIVHRRSVSATQLSHLQEFSITGLGGSGTIFASHSPRPAPPNPAFALPSPTAPSLDGLISHPVSVSASDGSFVTPLASPLLSPMTSPLRGGQAGGEGGVSPGGWHQRQGNTVKAPSPTGFYRVSGPASHHLPCNCVSLAQHYGLILLLLLLVAAYRPDYIALQCWHDKLILFFTFGALPSCAIPPSTLVHEQSAHTTCRTLVCMRCRDQASQCHEWTCCRLFL